MRTSPVDLGHPNAYRDGVPHDFFADLRKNEPVAWIPEPPSDDFDGGPGFWAVTKYADVVAVSMNPEIFSAHKGTVGLRDSSPQDLAMLQQMMVNIDPPDHIRLRTIVSQAFTPKSVQATFDSVVAHADAIVNGLEPDTEIDFVAEVAADMPLRVLADVLGIPVEDRGLLYNWTNRLVAQGNPAYGGRSGFVSAFMEMFAYAAEQTRIHRANPTNSVWSRIANAEVNGEQLTTEELNRFFQVLMIAGNETTRNLLTGAVRVLDQHPDQWQLLRDDPARIPAAIEEVLRYRSPIIQFRRTATRDTILNGQAIAEGDKVVIYYSSANRDEDVFENPDTFDIGRTPNDHLAFGSGPHFCLGNRFARLEGKVLLERLFARFPHMAVAGEPVRFPSNFINGIASLPVSLGPAMDKGHAR